MQRFKLNLCKTSKNLFSCCRLKSVLTILKLWGVRMNETDIRFYQHKKIDNWQAPPRLCSTSTGLTEIVWFSINPVIQWIIFTSFACWKTWIWNTHNEILRKNIFTFWKVYQKGNSPILKPISHLHTTPLF